MFGLGSRRSTIELHPQNVVFRRKKTKAEKKEPQKAQEKRMALGSTATLDSRGNEQPNRAGGGQWNAVVGFQSLSLARLFRWLFRRLFRCRFCNSGCWGFIHGNCLQRWQRALIYF